MARNTSLARAGRRFLLSPTRPERVIRPSSRYEPVYLPVADFSHPRWQKNSATIPSANTIRLAVSGAGGVARSAWWNRTIDVTNLRVNVRAIISGSADSISVGFGDPASMNQYSVGGSGGSGGYLTPNVVGTFITLDRWNSQIRSVYANAGGSSSTKWTQYYSVSGTWDLEISLRPYGSPDLHYMKVAGYQGGSLVFEVEDIEVIKDLSYFGFVGATGGSTMNGDFTNLSMRYARAAQSDTRLKRPVNRGAMARAVR